MPVKIKQLKEKGTGTPFVPVTHWDAISGKPDFGNPLIADSTEYENFKSHMEDEIDNVLTPVEEEEVLNNG